MHPLRNASFLFFTSGSENIRTKPTNNLAEIITTIHVMHIMKNYAGLSPEHKNSLCYIKVKFYNLYTTSKET